MTRLDFVPIENFDADLFGLSAYEATLLDPQHRILLECAWEALEDAACCPAAYAGSTGVVVGSRISESLTLKSHQLHRGERNL